MVMGTTRSTIQPQMEIGDTDNPHPQIYGPHMDVVRPHIPGIPMGVTRPLTSEAPMGTPPPQLGTVRIVTAAMGPVADEVTMMMIDICTRGVTRGTGTATRIGGMDMGMGGAVMTATGILETGTGARATVGIGFQEMGPGGTVIMGMVTPGTTTPTMDTAEMRGTTEGALTMAGAMATQALSHSDTVVAAMALRATVAQARRTTTVTGHMGTRGGTLLVTLHITVMRMMGTPLCSLVRSRD